MSTIGRLLYVVHLKIQIDRYRHIYMNVSKVQMWIPFKVKLDKSYSAMVRKCMILVLNHPKSSHVSSI